MTEPALLIPAGIATEDPKTQLYRLGSAFKDMDFTWEHAETLAEMYQQYRKLKREFEHYKNLRVKE